MLVIFKYNISQIIKTLGEQLLGKVSIRNEHILTDHQANGYIHLLFDFRLIEMKYPDRKVSLHNISQYSVFFYIFIYIFFFYSI